ncbi:MAG: hypothetical protein QW429_01560 [Thermoprotei archaeon]
MSTNTEKGHINWLKGLKYGSMLGFASFLFGVFLQQLALLSGTTSFLTNPLFVIVVSIGGVAFGFSHGLSENV